MVRPTIHTTPEAKQQAAREKRRKYYARHKQAINAKRRKFCRPDTRKAQREGMRVSDDEEQSLHGRDDDISDSEIITLADCLAIMKDAKDELVALTDTPWTFVASVLQEFVASMNSRRRQPGR
ncbi:hypothetical protein BV22DRAFT_1135280 [Leucogyrophana mollusca]|uniref:Uncharacterized protein n=1 Tax=Leucogyrophana mollusca TaxID=85980 RepID=A0ACB8AWF6_9AGAM|nr:hypothetical protein BV22DRAFT_1135280 [Leucogyrophana mollusca]